jgi:glucosamine-6-phosphate deaminase
LGSGSETRGVMSHVRKSDLYEWCKIPASALESHPKRKMPFRLVRDSGAMGLLMAQDLVSVIEGNNQANRPTRAIIPCGPKCWYEPFTKLVNQRAVSLGKLFVFHMDECLDWQAHPLPKNHPYNFRTFMERYFYGGILPNLAVPEEQRFWLLPSTADRVKAAIGAAPIDITVGGWGQDGHLAYNQARRHPYSPISLEELEACTIRVQENNLDTILALAQRSFGGAYQFVPPMSITLGMRECLSAKRVRVYSDTGSWKQTALRVALFAEPTPEYPMTLLQQHADALITATEETAIHPISENLDWELF